MRIGVMTGGDGALGLNAAIRAVVLRADALGHTAATTRRPPHDILVLLRRFAA